MYHSRWKVLGFTLLIALMVPAMFADSDVPIAQPLVDNWTQAQPVITDNCGVFVATIAQQAPAGINMALVSNNGTTASSATFSNQQATYAQANGMQATANSIDFTDQAQQIATVNDVSGATSLATNGAKMITGLDQTATFKIANSSASSFGNGVQTANGANNFATSTMANDVGISAFTTSTSFSDTNHIIGANETLAMKNESVNNGTGVALVTSKTTF